MHPNYITELNEHNFESTLQQSMEQPIVFYFWAPISPESNGILPIMEKIAHEYAGAFTLALIDCEKEQLIAAQFGIHTLPTIALFSQGQPVDGLAGMQSEESIRQMLAPHLPNQAELALKQAKLLIQEEKYLEAIAQLKPLQATLEQNGEFKLALAQCYVETQQFDLAEPILASVLMQDQDATYKSLVAKIELFKQAADTPEIRELQAAHEAEPANFAIAYELAIKLSQINKQEEALTLLIMILRADLNYAKGDAKKTMMDILTALGQGNEIAARFRRQLYALLY